MINLRMASKRPPDQLSFLQSKAVKLDARKSGPSNKEAAKSPCNHKTFVKSKKSTNKKPKKSLEDVKEEIATLLSDSSEKCGHFAAGSVLSDAELSSAPNIDIKGYGILPLPVNKHTFDSVKPLCSLLPFGDETTENVGLTGNIFQLDPQQFVIKNVKFVNQVASLIEDKISFNLGLGFQSRNISVKICKLLICKAGRRFCEQRNVDMESQDGMFGSLVIQLPSVFTGGDLIVKHDNFSKVFNNSAPEKSSRCSFVAHYASCPHELTEITSGYRVALVYSLCWEGNEIKPSPSLASRKTAKLCNLLNEYFDEADIFQWVLQDYRYPLNDISDGVSPVENLKSCDKNVISALKNALEYDKMQYCKDRWELYIANADKEVTEYGFCSRENHGRSFDGYRRCFEMEFVDQESTQLSRFTPLSTNGSMVKFLKFDFDPEDAVNFYDDYDDFWGDDMGTGCSGPTKNEGVTRDRWYQRKVFVLWRADKSLSIKLKSGVSAGVDHIYSVLKKKDSVEAKRGFLFLWKSLDWLWSDYKSLTDLIKLCTTLRRTHKVCELLKELLDFGIPDSYTANVIAHVGCVFKENAKIVSGVRTLLEKSHRLQIKYVLQCCTKIAWLNPTETIELAVNYTLENVTTNKVISMKDNNDHASQIYSIVLEFMLKHKTFPSGSIEKIVSLIDTLTEMDSVISTLIEITVENIKLDLFLSRFVSMASDSLSHRNLCSPQVDPEEFITGIFKSLLTKYSVKRSIGKTLVELINSIKISNNSQIILKLLTHQILLIFPDKENMPRCLLDACRFRFNHLKGAIRSGQPEFSWKQPNAVVPDHPLVEEFLRGPAQSCTYRNFSNLSDARDWADEHRYDDGCFMKLSTIGRGSTAAVKIVKTTEGFKNVGSMMKKNKQEFNKLLSVLSDKN